MKKYCLFIIILLVYIIPVNVYANIQCNDGTISPSCSDCHRGCCSHHGGCASSSSPSASNNNSNVNATVEEDTDIEFTDTSSDEPEETEDNQEEVVTKEENTEKKDDDSFASGLLGLLGIGSVISAVAISKDIKKRNSHS